VSGVTLAPKPDKPLLILTVTRQNRIQTRD
jgi:hypothetical protein